MGASDETSDAQTQTTNSEDPAAASTGADELATTSFNAAQSPESADGDSGSEWGEGLDWEVVDPKVDPAPARAASASASDRQTAGTSSQQQLFLTTAPDASSSPDLEHAASEASGPPSESSSLSASDAHEESESEEEASLRRGRQLADTLATAEAVTAPAYDLALALGEGALAAALEGRAEPFPQLEESEEERDAFEAEFQRVLAEMGRPRS
ncbi:hypothetical protein CHLRE_06g263900v5 [Chlamydomonas reinhardtii]|uniref:Uncharacterized protein n=1 Tax=Chlamydomonas reinhardtii TaxID=3055 RepID=A0A2K3DMX9_CHLRE|nr:uncharacterized protein CHLRE_06g263900v5 [Chlamydomonas reinhardtii]PNW81871.1 hypothetical protein CHLRE_06g263900v5 [Chlamydomonas reinhardtii]